MRNGKHNIDRGEYLARAAEFAPRGTALPHAVLDEAKVRAIRANRAGWSRRQWAEHLGVHVRTIDKVATRETWAHVRDEP